MGLAISVGHTVKYWFIISFFLLAGALLAFNLLWAAPVQGAASNGSRQAWLQTNAPDLIVESITLTPANPGPGDIADITVVLKNQGDVAAAGFWVHLYVEQVDDPPTQTTPPTTQTFYGLTLAPNDTFTWTRTEQVFTKEQPIIYAWIDPPWKNRVAEANEDNNLLRLPALVTPTATPSNTPVTPATPATPTPTATKGPNKIYLAMIVQMPTIPTPTSTPTSTPLPTWRRVGNGSVIAAALAVADEVLFVGERKDTGSVGGLYNRPLDACVPTPPLLRILGINSTVAGLAFQAGQGVLAAYDLGIYYSEDSGQNWAAASDAISHPGTVAVSDNGVFYAGSQDGGTYRSEDGGRRWQRLPWTPKEINFLKFVAGTLWIGTQTGLWQLPANAAQPQEQSGGLNDAQSKQVWDLAFHNASTVYIATFNGVYQGDGVNAWQPVGLQGKQLYSLGIAGDYLYAGARSDGVWRRSLAGGDWTRVTSAGWNDTYIVRDLLTTATCPGLLAATNDGVWMFQ